MKEEDWQNWFNGPIVQQRLYSHFKKSRRSAITKTKTEITAVVGKALLVTVVEVRVGVEVSFLDVGTSTGSFTFLVYMGLVSTETKISELWQT